MMTTAVVVVCILYVAAFLAARTAGFKSMVEDRIEKAVGIPVRIEKTRATVGLDLVMEGAVSENGGRIGKAGFRVGKAVLSWSVMDRVRMGGGLLRAVDIRDASLFFAPNEEGDWEPAFASGVGSWLGNWAGFSVRKPAPAAPVAASPRKETAGALAGAMRLPAVTNDWSDIALRVSGGRLVWWGAGGEEEAAIENIELTVTPLRLPNRSMTHLYVSFTEGRLGKERRLRDFALEMLRTGSNSIILGCNGGWTSGRSKDERDRRVEKGEPTNNLEVVGGDAKAVADKVRKELTEGSGD